MANRWLRSRMAADFHEDSVSINDLVDDLTTSLSGSIVIGGVTISATYGGDAYDDVDLLPGGYFRQYASATPAGRAGGYNPLAIEPERPPIDRGNIVTPAMLQREVRITGSGHGSGGGGRRRKKSSSSGSIVVAGANAGESYAQLHLGRHLVYGLTIGESEFYAPRRDEARAVLQQLAARVWIERTPPEPQATKQAGKPRPNFAVYGLSDEQIILLKACRGAARAALVDYAHQHDHGRIVARDATLAPDLPVAV